MKSSYILNASLKLFYYKFPLPKLAVTIYKENLLNLERKYM